MTPGSEMTAQTEQFDVGMNTDEVVIRLSDLSGRYDFVSESILYPSNASADVRSQLKEKGILKQHKRLFQTENRSYDTPIYVISSIAIYKNGSAAAQDLEASVNRLSADGTKSSVDVMGQTATVVKYRSQNGDYQTIAYLQQTNTVYYVLTTDDAEYRQTTTRNLLGEMASDVGQDPS